MNDLVTTSKPKNNIQVMQMARSQFMSVSKNTQIKWEAELRFAIQHLDKNDFLSQIAWSNQKSLQNAIVNVSAIGISLNPASKHAYLIPRKGVVCLDISYMGLIHLALSTGSITWVQAQIVRKNDEYINTGIDSKPDHKYQAFDLKARGEIVGVYCSVKTKNDDYLTEEMSIDDVWQIRDRSEAWKANKSGPWLTDVEQMIKKTVVKRASSYWPKVEMFQEAVNMLNAENGEGIEFEKEQQIDKRTRPGRNPNYLPANLKNVYLCTKEALDSEDMEVIKDIFMSFGEIEEQIAVTKCFSSKERKIINEYINNNITLEEKNLAAKQYYLGEEELNILQKYNWENRKTALPEAPSNSMWYGQPVKCAEAQAPKKAFLKTVSTNPIDEEIKGKTIKVNPIKHHPTQSTKSSKVTAFINESAMEVAQQKDNSYFEQIESCANINQLFKLSTILAQVPEGDERQQLMIAYNEKGRSFNKS